MRLLVWSPLPPSPSGIADYVAEQLPLLAARADVRLVVEDPGAVEETLSREFRVLAADAADTAEAPDLDLYHLGNSPAHGYVYRQALRRPGVVVLHDFSLHHLVLRETVERGDRAAYLREMRRSYGEVGTFAGRQVARALGGQMLPALFPLNERVLLESLGVVALTRHVESKVRQRLPRGRLVLQLPHHLALPLDPLPARSEARRALGLPEQALLLTAPGLATAAKRLDVALRVLARLRERFPQLRLVVAGAVDPALPLLEWAGSSGVLPLVIATGRLSLPDFVRHLCAADVLLSLRFPQHGEISGALVRGLGVGRPAIVSAGCPSAEEFPEGVVLPIDPGPREEEQLLALLSRLLEDAPLRESISALAREHMLRHHDLAASVTSLVSFLEQVLAAKPGLVAAIEATRARPAGLLEYLHQELAFSAYDLGLAGFDLGTDELLAEIGEEAR